ncbi:MAG: glycosyltransferase family 4 protein [Caldilineaceae bacterium]
MTKLLVATTVYRTLRAFLAPYAIHFRALGWQVDAIAQGATDCPECCAAFDKVWEIEWARNPLHWQNFTTPQRLRQLVTQESYDLVHVHTPVAAFVLRFALRNLPSAKRPKVFYTAHGFHFYQGASPVQNRFFLTLEKLAGRWTDYLIVMNQEDQEAAQKHAIVPPHQVHYVPGIGLDTTFYAPEKTPANAVQAIRNELGLKAGEKLLLMIAHFDKGKRHADLLQALAHLQRPNLHLALVGFGPRQAKVQQLAAHLGLAPYVHFLGYRRDIPALLKSAVATVLLSDREGLPRSSMESLSMGVPVIGSNIRGLRDLLQNGNGYLVQNGDILGIAAAITRIVDQPEEVAQMSRRGREWIKRYDVAHTIRRHEALYATALQN